MTKIHIAISPDGVLHARSDQRTATGMRRVQAKLPIADLDNIQYDEVAALIGELDKARQTVRQVGAGKQGVE